MGLFGNLPIHMYAKVLKLSSNEGADGDNKTGKIEAMVVQIGEMIKRGILKQPEAAKIRRKMVYAEGQVFARQSALRPCALAHRATGRDRMKVVTSWIVSYLKDAIPKMIKVKHNGAAMAASSFPQTWDFCVYMVGFDDPEDIVGSPRVKRAVHVQYMKM